MRQAYHYLRLLILLSALAACGEEPAGELALGERQQQISRLVRSWAVDRVTFEGFDVTPDELTDLTITFREDNTWTAQEGDPVFGSSGTWELSEENINLLRMSGVEMVVTISPDVQLLRLEFVLTGGSIGTRTQGLDGEYLISFSARPPDG